MNPRVWLRDVEPGDLPMFFEHQRDPVAVAMVAFKSRDREAFDAHWAKILADETCLKKTIMIDGEVAGNIGSFEREQKREVGYWIDRAYWGRGVATAAVSAFLELETRRPLYAGVAPHNAASLRVLEKCGFTVVREADEQSAEGDDPHIILTLSARSGDRGA
jgi:RimJ/RimL family protein N-acetyltransferase